MVLKKERPVAVPIVLHQGRRTRTLHGEPGQTLYQILHRNGVPLSGSCGGRGRCGNCRLRIKTGIQRPTPAEKRWLRLEEVQQGVRLACQVIIRDSLAVEVDQAANRSVKGTILPIHLARLTPLLPAGTRNPGFGVALDLGTTTLALYLVDLSTGLLRGEVFRRNPGSRYGADVISRVGAAMEQRELLQTIEDDLKQVLSDGLIQLAKDGGVHQRNILSTVVVGNPIMVHFFHRLDPSPLTTAPFSLVTTGDLCEPASQFSLPLSGRGILCTPPLVSAYLGSDAIAALVSALDHRVPRPFLLLDLGTNAEVMLMTKQGLYGASTAAGPAFEGYALSCGLPGGSGAISSIRWSESRGLHIVVEGQPRGISGTGILDALSILLQSGAMELSGRLRSPQQVSSQIKKYLVEDSGRSFRIAPSVQLTQEDIRRLQLAKAAIATASKLLLERGGIRPKDLKVILLAGTFGSSLRTASSRQIGLFPDCNEVPVRAIGNAAGRGAILYLLDQHKRQLTATLAQQLQVLELARHPRFQDVFLASIGFPPIQH